VIEIEKPDLVGMGVLTPNVEFSLMLCERIKLRYPGILITLGGIHASLFPEKTLQNKNVDFVSLGEGEMNFYDFIYSVNHDINLSKVKSLGYKKDSKVHINEFNDKFIDMNEVGELKYEVIDIEKYLQYAKRQSGYRAIGYVASRGCAFNCSFCLDGNHKSIVRKWRAISPSLLVQYIKNWKEKFDIEGVWFKDSTFSVNKKWIMEFCRLLIENNVQIKWSCNSRVDCIDEDIIKAMSVAGCETIWFGVESGSERIIKLMNKRINKKQVFNTFYLCEKYGVRAWANFMIGVPTETVDDIEQTFNFAMELQQQSNVDTIHATVYTPFPGTPLYKLHHNEDFIYSIPPEGLTYDKACIDTGAVKKEVIQMIYDEMCEVFYKDKTRHIDFDKYRKMKN